MALLWSSHPTYIQACLCFSRYSHRAPPCPAVNNSRTWEGQGWLQGSSSSSELQGSSAVAAGWSVVYLTGSRPWRDELFTLSLERMAQPQPDQNTVQRRGLAFERCPRCVFDKLRERWGVHPSFLCHPNQGHWSCCGRQLWGKLNPGETVAAVGEILQSPQWKESIFVAMRQQC